MKLKNLRDFCVISLLILIVLSSEIFSGLAQEKKAINYQSQNNLETASFGNTAAEVKLAAWLAAFNTGKKEVLQQFISANFAPLPNTQLPVGSITDRHFGLFNNTHGLIPRKIIANSEKSAGMYLESKLTGFAMYIGMSVEENEPHRILGMGFRSTEMPADLLPKQKLTENQLKAKTDHLITDLSAADKFSGVILVAHNGKAIYQRATGMANKTWNISNRVDTKFNVASIGKMFTAVAVAQLVEQDKFSFNDPLIKILPDCPNKEIAQKVTIHHLLSHTSGIKEVSSIDNSLQRNFRSIKEQMSASTGDKLNFEPGTKLEYSNYGYLLLGAVIEKVSGESYYDYIREHIYKPAGMTDTDSYELDSEPQNLATGYMDAPNNRRVSNIFMLSVKGSPAGGGYSTAEDLVKFMSALHSGKLINQKSLETVWTGNLNYTEVDSKYGYGFIVKKYNGTRVIGHGGGWVGITNKFDMYPDLGYTVVILNNIDSDPNSIAFKLREWLTQGRNNQ